MIEIPAAALAVGLFLRRLHFLSIGTNDLIQYTLAIDRSDEQVAHLYDPLHPAVLMLLAHTIASAEKVHIPVSICGELAGDPLLTRLLLGMGLRQFSMHPAQILSVKQTIMQSNCAELAPIVRRMLRHEEPAKIREQLEKLNSLN
jgi:phosphotransferase system enzyme I (PtsI)